jgi:hypothetical protein
MPVVPASDYNQPILPVTATPTVTSVGANNADMVAATSSANYRFGIFAVSGFGSATVQVQYSADGGSTYVALPIKNLLPTSNGGFVQTGMTAAGHYWFSIPASGLIRIRTTAWSSGTIAGALQLTSIPPTIDPFPLAATLSGTSVGDGASTAQGAINYAGNAAPVAAGMYVFNNSNVDRLRNTYAATVLASAARTSTNNTDIITYNAKTARVILNITVAPNTASTLTVAIRVKDSISSNYIAVLTGAAETGSVDTGAVPVTKTYSIGAGLVATANISASEALTRTINVLVTHSNSDSWTYSVSVDLGV